ncbi:MAG: hypothetical protein ACRDKT_11295 [Actinomycetota bacterium]
MRTKRGWVAAATVMLVAMIGSVAMSIPAAAATAEPTITTIAWFWEEAQSQEFKDPQGNTVTIETPSPFCPGAGSGTGNPQTTCAQGRLPIEIHNGDYDTPNKLSAVAFDMSLVPVGSEVSSFVVTFREAATGCYETDGKPDESPQDDQCEETNPVNVGEHKLQACLVSQFFGDGDAREYSEAPTYGCSADDPIGERKEVKGKAAEKDGEGSNFYWTFDLTSFAQDWVKEFSTNTSVMLTGVPTGKDDTSSWRVVLAGPRFENGFTSKIVFTEPDIPVIQPPAPPGGTGTGSVPIDTGGGFSSTGTDFGSDPGTIDSGGGGLGGAPAPAETAPPIVATGGADVTPQGFPAYVWLAVLGGIMGFVLVRSTVLESAHGIRPNGVLATIHRINAENGGSAAAAAATSGSGILTVVGRGFKAAAGKIGSVFNLTKKG